METVYFVSPYFDKYPVPTEGESSYQANIQNAAGYIDDDKKRFRQDGFSAELVLEDSNPFDLGNAVRVDIDGETVGYLSKSNAARYRKALNKIGMADVIGICGAAVFGKREDTFEDMNFGVWLDIDLKELIVEPKQPSQKPIAQTTQAKSPIINKELASANNIKKSKIEKPAANSQKNLPLFFFLSLLVISVVIISMVLSSS